MSACVVEQLRAVEHEDERIAEATAVGGHEHASRYGQADLRVGGEGVRRDLFAGKGGTEGQPGPHEDGRGIEPRKLHAPGKGREGAGGRRVGVVGQLIGPTPAPAARAQQADEHDRGGHR